MIFLREYNDCGRTEYIWMIIMAMVRLEIFDEMGSGVSSES
ncbi:hypothetical protein [Eubacterium ruminantium]|nr:hypothetical protein [Eubacterium ruminantium]